MLSGGVENADIGALTGLVGSLSGGTAVIEAAMEYMERVYNASGDEFRDTTKANARKVHDALSIYRDALGETDAEIAAAAKATADEYANLVSFMIDFPEQIAALERQLTEGRKTGNLAMEMAALDGLTQMANLLASGVKDADGAYIALIPSMQHYLDQILAEHDIKIDSAKASQTIIDQYVTLKDQYEKAAIGSAARAEALQGLLNLYPTAIGLQELLAERGGI